MAFTSFGGNWRRDWSLKDRESDTQECRRKRRKFPQGADIAKQDPAEIDAEQPLLTEAGPNINPPSTKIAMVDPATRDEARDLEPRRPIADVSAWQKSAYCVCAIAGKLLVLLVPSAYPASSSHGLLVVRKF